MSLLVGEAAAYRLVSFIRLGFDPRPLGRNHVDVLDLGQDMWYGGNNLALDQFCHPVQRDYQCQISAR